MNVPKHTREKYALAAVMATIIFVVMFKFSYAEIVRESYSDLKDHLHLAESIHLANFKEAWLERPYIFWHLCVQAFAIWGKMPINDATAATCGMFAAFNCFVTFFIIDKIVSRYQEHSGIAAAAAAGMLNFAFPLRMYWFSQWHYEGQFSINPFFNPTHMAVKPFGLLVFAIAVDMILMHNDEERIFFTGRWFKKGQYVLYGFILFMSVFTKPTFAYMLLPAGMIYLLVELCINLWKKDGSAKKTWSFMWRIGCASIPAVLYVLLEYAAFYFWGGTNTDAKVAIYPFLTAWHLFSPDVPTSIVLGMAFPLWMLVTNYRFYLFTTEGRMSLLGYAVGVFEFSFFVETGSKLHHLNFSWPMMSGMLLFWVTATARLVLLSCQEEEKKWNNVVVAIGWVLLAIHVFSGFFYINPSAYIF